MLRWLAALARYKIAFVLDKTAMFQVKSPARTHHVKPLDVIWRKLPAVTAAHSTVHVDDLGRNFALNPRNGFKVQCRYASFMAPCSCSNVDLVRFHSENIWAEYQRYFSKLFFLSKNMIAICVYINNLYSSPD